MKKILFVFGTTLLLTSCATSYQVTSGNLNQTTVELTKANFKNLGTFSGSVSEKRTKAGIKNMEGLISRAKTNLIENAKKEGVTISGSKTMSNVSVDIMKNWKRVTVTVSADIIEFTQ